MRMLQESGWSPAGWDDLNACLGAERNQLPARPTSEHPPQERRMCITKADVDKFGPTDGCPGCACEMVGGLAEVHHKDHELLQQSVLDRTRLESRRRKRSGEQGKWLLSQTTRDMWLRRALDAVDAVFDSKISEGKGQRRKSRDVQQCFGEHTARCWWNGCRR